MSCGMNFTMDISTQMNMIMLFSYFIYILLAMMKLTMTMIQCMSDDRFPELNFIIVTNLLLPTSGSLTESNIQKTVYLQFK